MPVVDTSELKVIERLPGWRARIFNSASMTFAHYEFDAGSTIHAHSHEQEEVWNVIEGELEVTIDGVAQVARPGVVAIVPPDTAALRPRADRRAGDHRRPPAALGRRRLEGSEGADQQLRAAAAQRQRPAVEDEVVAIGA